MMKKSKIVQELGVEVLDSIKERMKVVEAEFHPFNTQFDSDEDLAYVRGYINALKETHFALYSSINLKYNQALAEETNESNS